MLHTHFSVKHAPIYSLLVILVLVSGTSLERADGQEAISPDTDSVKAMVRPAVAFLKKSYHEKQDVGVSSITGLALFNAGLRLGKSKRELQKDSVLTEILDQLSRDVMQVTPESETSVVQMCMAGTLLLEVDANTYEKQIKHILSVLEARQSSSGAWRIRDSQKDDPRQTLEAALFLWLARQKRIPIKASMVLKSVDSLIALQRKSGEFSDQSTGTTPFLTAAGVGGLHILGKTIGPRRDKKEIVVGFENATQRGDDWLQKHYSPNATEWTPSLLYVFEKYASFQEDPYAVDDSPTWYVSGVKTLKTKQADDGSWSSTNSSEKGKIQETAFATLFLVRSTKLVIPSYMDIIEGGAENLPAKGLLNNMNRVPGPADRWIIKYSTSSRQAYAAQLDFFGIEIASISKDSAEIEYAYELSKSKPAYRKGTRDKEKRAYFRKPKDHPVIKWDASYLKAVGAKTDDRSIRLFYPQSLYQRLLQLQKQALRRDNKVIDDVRQIIFSVEAARGGGYQYKLIMIRYK